MDCAEFSTGKLLLALIDNDIPVPIVTTFEGVGYFDYSKANDEYYRERNHKNTTAVERAFDICERIGLRTSMLLDRPITTQELIQEAKFADLLILDHAIPFDSTSTNGYTNRLQELLQTAACPVLILRDGAILVEELIFTYNGTASSIFSIRQFTQLFPGLSDRPASLLYVAEEHSPSVPQHEKIMSYLQYHYSKIGVRILKGRPSTEITNFLRNRRTAMVTFGAYGRSNLSLFFHPSDADDTLRTLKLPVFITHM